jgi:chorismate mutase-like protein
VTREEAIQALEEYRVSIDALDLRLLALLNERTRVVEDIGRVKRAAKLPIYEPRREEQVFENITIHNGGPLTPDAVKRIFERIIDEMRTIQRIRMQTSVETSTDGDS